MATRKRAEAKPTPELASFPLSAPRIEGDGRVRAVIDAVIPCIDGGRFAAKCIAGEPTAVQANCLTDGHDSLRVMLQWRAEAASAWNEVEMTADWNDEWHGRFVPPAPGPYRYRVMAWVDHFESWRHELVRRVDADDIRVAAKVGAQLLDATVLRAAESAGAEGDGRSLREWADRLRHRSEDANAPPETLKSLALDDALRDLARRHPDRALAAVSEPLPIWADRARAQFSSWYELFPRSAAPDASRHGTFADVEARLPYVAELGFDVLYFPPIHPIGRVKRKGRNNAVAAEAGDVGSPWAIGSDEGGHKSLLPELGTPEDFRRLVRLAHGLGIEIALDIAFQCAPDHPYVKEHPQWFRWRPDGSVQYAENPPKKYQDIYPFDFETDDWQALWIELKSVFDHWIGEGVKIFRVDNPHTKAFPFWEWCIREVQREHPDVLFLAEAFTRPKLMHRLAKLGFTQSYTYFTWRNSRQELVDYFNELAHGPGRDYFRPNAWPNTPDILNEHLHHGNRAVFALRLVLAATLSSSYGIYGPAYELLEGRPRQPGSEEYLDSEKYQLRHWDLEHPDSLRHLIARVNRVRRENPALHGMRSLKFCGTENPQLLGFTKRTEAGDNIILTVVNLDPHNTQYGWIDIDPQVLDIDPEREYTVHDLLSGAQYIWRGTRNYIVLDPGHAPAHIFRVQRRVRREQQFDAFG